MQFERFNLRLSQKPRKKDYLFGLMLLAAALLVRALLEILGPGIGPFITLLPAVAVVGVFCGTGPAIAGAIVAEFGAAWFLFENPSTSAATYFNAALYVPACAVIIVATTALRGYAARAMTAEARLAEIFRQIPGAAAILQAPDGRLLLSSAQSDAVLGADRVRVANTDDLNTFGGLHPDGRSYTADDYPIVRALKFGEVVSGQEILYRQPGGRLINLEVHAGPVRDAQGRIIAAVGTAFDITQRVAAETRLRQSEADLKDLSERLRAAIEAGGLGLWEHDVHAQTTHIDAAFATMLELPPAATTLADSEIEQLVEPAERARALAIFAGATPDTGDAAYDVPVRSAQNNVRWLVLRGVLLADIGKVIGVVRDVTGRRLREEALHAALQARDVLMREADHRIKNSLQLVVSLLSLQRGRVSDPDARDALTAAIARVTAVADAHLALQNSPDLRSLDIDQMLADLCERVGSLNPDISLQYKTAIDHELDAEQAIPLCLIASEILTNALRHAYPTGTQGKVTLDAKLQDDAIELRVTDTGAGMPTAPTRRGLGTTVIATLARQIGATITIESEIGHGTAVQIRLPQTAPAAQPKAPATVS